MKRHKIWKISTNHGVEWCQKERVFFVCSFVLCACPTRMVVVLQGSEEDAIPWNVTNFMESIFVVVYFGIPVNSTINLTWFESGKRVCLHTVLSTVKCLNGLSLFVPCNCPSKQSHASY